MTEFNPNGFKYDCFGTSDTYLLCHGPREKFRGKVAIINGIKYRQQQQLSQSSEIWRTQWRNHRCYRHFLRHRLWPYCRSQYFPLRQVPQEESCLKRNQGTDPNEKNGICHHERTRLRNPQRSQILANNSRMSLLLISSLIHFNYRFHLP